MNIMIWLIAGGLIGWAGLHFFEMNRDRGLIPAVLICAAGGFMGGNSVAPMPTASVTDPIVGFSPFALVVALAVAIATLFISNDNLRKGAALNAVQIAEIVAADLA